MTIVIFFIVLAVLILVHELGHFLVAKKAGVKVEEFGLGFPPRLWGVKWGETLYSLNWIPFGGFVKILGENAEEGDQESIVLPEDVGRSLSSRSRPVQALVLVAGVSFNILLAWIILSFGLWVGLPTSRDGVPAGFKLDQVRLIVTEVVKDSPASLAGMKGGETILYVKNNQETLNKPSVVDLQKFVAENSDQKISLGYSKEFNDNVPVGPVEVELQPKLGSTGDHPVIGVSLTEIGILKLPFFSAIVEGFKLTALVLWSIVLALGGLVSGLFQGQTAVLSSVTGPVGLIGVIGSSVSMGFSYLLNLVAVISLNLAVINLLPFPALDGGRVLFLAVEGLIKRPLSPKFVNFANGLGFYLLIGLMLVLTYRDISRLFIG